MTIEPFFALPSHVQLHAAAGVASLVLGPVALYGAKSGPRHKLPGYAWVVAMATLAITGLFISDFASDRHFGVLHLFSVLTLSTLTYGLHAAIRGRIRTHLAAYRALYWNGLMIAGAFNFLPGRAVNRAFFPEAPEAGWIVLGSLIAALVLRAIAPLVRRPAPA